MFGINNNKLHNLNLAQKVPVCFKLASKGDKIASMIKAVIFDLNGVFLKSRYLSERMGEKYHISGEEFHSALKEVMEEARQPGLDDSFVLWKPHLEKLGLSLTKEEFFDFWFSGEELVPELLEWTKDLRQRGLKVFILSNNFRERTEYYRQKFPELFQNLDGTYFSWETGFVKPDPDAYRRLMSEQNLKPKDCVYFDNSDRNIEVAQQLGINSFRYEGLESARKSIEDFGISVKNMV